MRVIGENARTAGASGNGGPGGRGTGGGDRGQRPHAAGLARGTGAPTDACALLTLSARSEPCLSISSPPDSPISSPATSPGSWALVIVVGLFDGRPLRPAATQPDARVEAISGVSFQESIRRRVLWITPLAILGVIVVAGFQKAVDPLDDIRQATKVCLFATGVVVIVDHDHPRLHEPAEGDREPRHLHGRDQAHHPARDRARQDRRLRPRFGRDPADHGRVLVRVPQAPRGEVVSGIRSRSPTTPSTPRPARCSSTTARRPARHEVDGTCGLDAGDGRPAAGRPQRPPPHRRARRRSTTRWRSTSPTTRPRSSPTR